VTRVVFFFLDLLMQVGQIYQKFECKDQSDGGIVRNVVRWSIENLLEVNLVRVLCLLAYIENLEFKSLLHLCSVDCE